MPFRLAPGRIDDSSSGSLPTVNLALILMAFTELAAPVCRTMATAGNTMTSQGHVMAVPLPAQWGQVDSRQTSLQQEVHLEAATVQFIDSDTTVGRIPRSGESWTPTPK